MAKAEMGTTEERTTHGKVNGTAKDSNGKTYEMVTQRSIFGSFELDAPI